MKFKDKKTGAVVDIANEVILPLYEKSENFTKVKEKNQKPEENNGSSQEKK